MARLRGGRARDPAEQHADQDDADAREGLGLR
jgi:hypothetical protein